MVLSVLHLGLSNTLLVENRIALLKACQKKQRNRKCLKTVTLNGLQKLFRGKGKYVYLWLIHVKV